MQIRRTLTALVTLTSLCLATACAGDDLAEDEAGDDAGSSEATGGPVTLSSQDFDEAALVTAMYAALLEEDGYTVTTKLVGSRDIYMGEFPGEVDIVPEYVGGITDFLNTSVNGPEAEPLTSSDTVETIANVTPLLEEKGITLLEPSQATSQNAYFVTQDFSDAEGVTQLSDLEGKSVVLAAAPDCEGRADCEVGLRDVYGIDITELLPLGYASPQTYKSVIDGESELGQTGTLDGTLEDQGLVLLEDDKGIQPAQNLIPAVADDFLADHPDVDETLNGLMAELDNDTLAELLVRVSIDREKPADVATDFLETSGLL